jgi:hypothetical protein
MRQRAEVLGHLTEIAAVDPTTARRTFDEVLGFTLRPIANALAGIFPARSVNHGERGRA